MPNNEQAYAKASFEKAADHYDQIAFFKQSATEVVRLIKAHTQATDLNILDVACGTGNVTLECAQQLPQAQFLGIDISAGMLSKAKHNAQQRQLKNIEFKEADITTYRPTGLFDVITCSYALFFLPDAHLVLNTLQQSLNQHGCLLFTSFTNEAFDPANPIFLKQLRQLGSPSALAYDEHHWKNLKHHKDILYLCELAKAPTPTITTQNIRYPLTLGAWWTLFNNTGFKGMIDELSPSQQQQLKTDFYTLMQPHCDDRHQVELIADSFFVKITAS